MLETIFNVDILKAVVPLVSGLVVGWLTYLVNNRKTSIDGEVKYRDQLLEQIKTLSERLDAVEAKYREQMLELVDLRAKNARLEGMLQSQFNHLEVYESYCAHMPNPAWLKDLNGNMVFINEAYSTRWRVSRLKYEGRPDHAVWPERVADRFKANDDLVIKELRGIRFLEEVPDDPANPSSTTSVYEIWKFPVTHRDELIGVGGVALKQENNKQ